MRERAAAGFYQQGIDMSVVAPVELDDLVASRERAREPNARRSRFRAAIHHPHFLDRRHPLADQFRHFHFERIRNSKAQPARGSVAHGVHDHFRRMPENRRPPAPDVIEIFISIEIPNFRAFCTRDKERFATNVTKRAHGRIHPAGNPFAGARKKLR